MWTAYNRGICNTPASSTRKRDNFLDQVLRAKINTLTPKSGASRKQRLALRDLLLHCNSVPEVRDAITRRNAIQNRRRDISEQLIDPPATRH